MPPEATQEKPATAGANDLRRAMRMMTQGVVIIGVGEVKERGPRTFEGRQSEVMTISAHGFEQTFYADDPSEFQHWPEQGQWVEFSCPVKRTKDGTYRVNAPSSLKVVDFGL